MDIFTYRQFYLCILPNRLADLYQAVSKNIEKNESIERFMSTHNELLYTGG